MLGGIVSGAGSLLGGLFGAGASKSAASQQAAAAQQAIALQNKIFDTQQANQKPYQDAGATSIQQLMSDLKSGKFNIGAAPTAPGAPTPFAAPTAEEAAATPGYQFTQQQGEQAINRGQAAAGGAFTGGTLKALDQFNSGLANSTYNDVFNRNLNTYQTNLNATMGNYQQQLQGYGAQLQGTGQAFQQEFAPAQLGENAAASINNTGSQVANNLGNLITSEGNTNAAGTIGAANSLIGGATGLTNSLGSAISLAGLLKPQAGKEIPLPAQPSRLPSWASSIPGVTPG